MARSIRKGPRNRGPFKGPVISSSLEKIAYADTAIAYTGIVLVSEEPIYKRVDHGVLFRYQRAVRQQTPWNLLFYKQRVDLVPDLTMVPGSLTVAVSQQVPIPPAQPTFLLNYKGRIDPNTYVETFFTTSAATSVVSQKTTQPPPPTYPPIQGYSYEVLDLNSSPWQEFWIAPKGANIQAYRQFNTSTAAGQPWSLFWPPRPRDNNQYVENFLGMLSTSVVQSQQTQVNVLPGQPFSLLYWNSDRSLVEAESFFRVPDNGILNSFRLQYVISMGDFAIENPDLNSSEWQDPWRIHGPADIQPFRQYPPAPAAPGTPWHLTWYSGGRRIEPEDYSPQRPYNYTKIKNPGAYILSITRGVYTLNGYSVTLSGSGGAALHGAVRKVIYVVSPTGKTKWVDYLPVKINFPNSADINRYNDIGALGIHTLSSNSGLVAWVDYIPVVIVGTTDAKKWRYDDDGHLPVVEVIDP